MTICVQCKHLIRVWPNDSPEGQGLGWDNFGCRKSTMEPLCDPVTGELMCDGPGVRIEERIDGKMTSVAFYERCRDVNEGDCPMYEEKS